MCVCVCVRACVRACTGGYCAAPRVAGGTTRNTVAWAAQCRPSLHTTPQHLSPPDFFPRTACLPCSCRCLQSSGSYHLKNGLGPTQHTFFLLYHFFSFILAPRKGLGLKKSSKLEPFCTKRTISFLESEIQVLQKFRYIISRIHLLDAAKPWRGGMRVQHSKLCAGRCGPPRRQARGVFRSRRARPGPAAAVLQVSR